MRPCATGFTLIELAVVIAIIAILAAIAIPRFSDMTDSAEKSMANELAIQLRHAASVYTAEQATIPSGFTDFVEDTELAAAEPKTISLATFGPNGTGCTVTAATITCTAAFNKLSRAEYLWRNNSVVSNIEE